MVNVTEVKDEDVSHAQPAKRQMTGVNPIVEYENDNSPMFARLTPDGLYVFPVDWQASMLQAVARVQAFDPDEKSNLTYRFTHSLADEFFALNQTSGVISVIKSLMDTGDEVFNLEVAVSDGTNEARAPVKLYKLQPGTNIVIVESDQSVDKIDELQVVRQLSAALDLDVRVLVKQVYIGEDGHPNTAKSHLLVYALDKLSKVPVDAVTLKSMLDAQLPKMKQLASVGNKPGAEMILHLVSVTAPLSGSQFHLSFAEFLLLGVSGVLLLMACCLLFLLLRCCKRRQMLTKTDLEYMVDSDSAGPRPYNVDLITRKMAQSILSARPLPDPREEVTMTPESRATMIRHSSSGLYTSNNRNGSSALSSIDNQREASLPATGLANGTGAHHNLTYDSSSSSSESLNQNHKSIGSRPAPPPPIQ
uniref:Cadherin domain-containing protein n=1 Tax=Ditylenchus dipsaci TaxID=166011 RepID=A0A915E6W0_9BILA